MVRYINHHITQDLDHLKSTNNKAGARFLYVNIQISRDPIPAAYENEKNSLTYLVWLPL